MVGLGAAIDTGLKILDKVIPDPDAKREAKQKLIELQQAGELKELETRMSAIVMEAKSNDPWTSRARPSFLYVMYIMILFSIPMGFLFAFNPDVAENVIKGVQGWLGAIPTELYSLFGVGYLGYANKRSQDKALMMGKEPKDGWLSKILG